MQLRALKKCLLAAEAGGLLDMQQVLELVGEAGTALYAADDEEEAMRQLNKVLTSVMGAVQARQKIIEERGKIKEALGAAEEVCTLRSGTASRMGNFSTYKCLCHLSVTCTRRPECPLPCNIELQVLLHVAALNELLRIIESSLLLWDTHCVQTMLTRRFPVLA